MTAAQPSATVAPVGADALAWFIWVLVAAAVAMVAAPPLHRRRRLGRMVAEHSEAMSAVGTLNGEFSPLVRDGGVLRLHFGFTTDSKAKFDRFRLHDAMLDAVDEIEERVLFDVERRLAAAEEYEEYEIAYHDIATRLLGTSQVEGVDQRRFDAAEAKRFRSAKLPRPVCRASAVGTVGYTSPKGRNSYRRSVEWSFEELVTNLAELGQRDERRSRIAAERRKMTSRMRVDVLRRDGYRCQMCGRKAADIEMHVDHIVPVSRGGTTEMTNLQTLCIDCNLGKSNRFSG